MIFPNVSGMAFAFMEPQSYFWALLLWVSFSMAFIEAADRDIVNREAKNRMKPSAEQQWPLDIYSSRQAILSNEHEAHSARSDELDIVLDTSMAYSALSNAVHVMESHFFSVSQGTWPDAIDWTAAVMGTQVSASLSAISEHSSLQNLSPLHALSHENLINRYFTQITAFYFGEDAFSLRTQAYDDMLWVVLGWIESIKFINRHSRLHYGRFQPGEVSKNWSTSWYARQFIPQFAHRARLFYDLAIKGWDTTLCGGGMVWNPHLAPYKNAITNQLFIAASVSMYLYFPGDDNPSPFAQPAIPRNPNAQNGVQGKLIPPAKAHDKRYLESAIEAYKWLKNSGMRNTAGLYVDGFHIRGWRGGRHGSNGTEQCDLRDETVYTYNQGVILTALRGLWEATGEISYLEEGHELIKDVVKATGWENRDTERKYQWAGLGRNGIMEEICDWSGLCSQDGQTFKGIFWHHFTAFCSPLPASRDHDNDDNEIERENKKLDQPWLGDEATRALHQQSCDGYGPWITANARAAWVTRDHAGEFGTWWGRPWPGRRRDFHEDDNGDQARDRQGADAKLEAPLKHAEGVDYRNKGVPMDAVWYLTRADYATHTHHPNVAPLSTAEKLGVDGARTWDLNDRGRGRTVETQSGGVAVVRALWKLVESRKEHEGED